MKDKRLANIWDAVCCLLLLPIMAGFLPVEYWWSDNPFFVVGVVVWMWLVWLFNSRVAAPRLLRKEKWWIALSGFIVTLVGTYVLVCYSRNVAPIDDYFDYKTIGRVRRLSLWFVFGITFCFSLLIGSLLEWQQRLLQQQRIEHERDKAELALYKAQINPHFLFNTLNTLWSLVLMQSEHTEEAFMRFADMLRFTGESATRDKIAVDEEIVWLTDYIDLQRLRLNEHTRVQFCVEAEEQAEIAPMLLITFVENAFKYGVSAHEDGVIDIALRLQNGQLLFSASNPVRTQRSVGTGIGIANCRKRLQLLYPDKHKLTIQNEEGNYTVLLFIDLK
ncbi:MAG: histidine kinase [Paludibacter sp.]|nr:histidine kinase [Bacteroidales bacterium]MCM1068857.1 histidine kinase [Prevotella sp.]MCM1353118.1 histidine kinase [Bacteroides sp.]MCM1442440.1 histidine kinase [Muribaculum sp.]MCM1481283.1 histidine kinase [Paludibacter sp.]